MMTNQQTERKDEGGRKLGWSAGGVLLLCVPVCIYSRDLGDPDRKKRNTRDAAPLLSGSCLSRDALLELDSHVRRPDGRQVDRRTDRQTDGRTGGRAGPGGADRPMRFLEQSSRQAAGQKLKLTGAHQREKIFCMKKTPQCSLMVGSR